MVVVALTPYRGNHQRFFPHAGFLGLTPVLLQGTFSAALEEDLKPLLATHAVVRVRCYEADVSNSGTKGKSLNVLYENSLTVWKKKDEDQFTPLSEEKQEWRLIVPRDCPSPGTASFRHYRIWWQLEAVVYHKPSALLGSRKVVVHQVPLRRFAPPRDQTVLPVPSWVSAASTAVRGVGYSASLHSSVFGPADDLGLEITFDFGNANVLIKKVVVSIERRMHMKTKAAKKQQLAQEASPANDGFSYPSTSTASLLRRNTPPLNDTYHAPTGYVTTSTIVMTSEHELRTGHTNKIAASVPKMKSLFRYATGETMASDLAHIAFFVCIKFATKVRGSGSEWITLEPRPITLTGVSSEEREKAASAAHKLLAVAEAENRIFDKRSGKKVETDSDRHVSIGSRRASNFAMRIDIPGDAADAAAASLPSPTRSVGSQSSGRDFLAEPLPDVYRLSSEQRSRRRQPDESDAVAGPSRSNLSSTQPPELTDRLLASPHDGDSGGNGVKSVTRAAARRSARSPNPYTTLRRPRSIGQLSGATSMRSDDSASVSSRSIASSGSSMRTGQRAGRHVDRDRQISVLSNQTLLPSLAATAEDEPLADDPGLAAAKEKDGQAIMFNPLPTPISPPIGYPRGSPDLARMSGLDTKETSSPLIDFSTFTLKPQSNFTTMMTHRQDIDMAIVAPWTIADEVNPLETTPPTSARERSNAPSGLPVGPSPIGGESSRRTLTSAMGTIASAVLPASQSRTSSPRRGPTADKMDVEKQSPPDGHHPSLQQSPLGAAAQLAAGDQQPQQPGKRKGSVGFGLFAKMGEDKGEGAKWPFMRRSSKTTAVQGS